MVGGTEFVEQIEGLIEHPIPASDIAVDGGLVRGVRAKLHLDRSALEGPRHISYHVVRESDSIMHSFGALDGDTTFTESLEPGRYLLRISAVKIASRMVRFEIRELDLRMGQPEVRVRKTQVSMRIVKFVASRRDIRCNRIEFSRCRGRFLAARTEIDR